MSTKSGPTLDRRSLLLLLGAGASAGLASLAARRMRWSLIEPRGNPERALTLAAYARKAELEDVLIVGSSRVGGGIDCATVEGELRLRLGVAPSVYKLGLPGLRPALLAELLAELVLTRPPRRLLVLALDERFFSFPLPEDAAETVGEPQGQGEWSENLLSGPWAGLRGPRAVWTLDWALDPDTRAQVARIREHAGEFFTIAERLKRDQGKRLLSRTKADPFDLPPGMRWGWSGPHNRDQRAFRHCLDLLAELACPLLWIRMPLQPRFAELELALPIARLQTEILPQLAQRQMRYADLNGAPWPTEDEHFLGKTHLSYAGSQLLSRQLASAVLAPLLGGA